MHTCGLRRAASMKRFPMINCNEFIMAMNPLLRGQGQASVPTFLACGSEDHRLESQKPRADGDKLACLAPLLAIGILFLCLSRTERVKEYSVRDESASVAGPSDSLASTFARKDLPSSVPTAEPNHHMLRCGGHRSRRRAGPPPTGTLLNHTAAAEFIERCFARNEPWKGYSRVHSERFCETIERSLSNRFVAANSTVLHVGDGQGYLPILLYKFVGVTQQVSLDFMPTTASYRDHPRAGTCEYVQSKDGGGSEWDYTIRYRPADFDATDPWAGVPASSFDVAFALEVVEHLWAGPQNMFLNIARSLKLGGHLVVTTPNSNSFTTLQRVIDGTNPFSYSPFRLNYKGVPAPEHVKEYSVEELDGALKHSGFSVAIGSSMSPYHHPRGERLTHEMLAGLQRPLKDHAATRRGEVHFVVGAKVGCGTASKVPCYAAWKPLYDFERIVGPVM